MSPRENPQLALGLPPREFEVSDDKRSEVVKALAELLLSVARARARLSERGSEEDSDDL